MEHFPGHWAQKKRGQWEEPAIRAWVLRIQCSRAGKAQVVYPPQKVVHYFCLVGLFWFGFGFFFFFFFWGFRDRVYMFSPGCTGKNIF